MSIETLQQDITKGEGYILSDGTLNLRHLLPKAYDLIQAYALIITPSDYASKAGTIATETLGCFKPETEDLPLIINHGLRHAQYYGRVSLAEDSETQETAGYLWNEDIFNLFNDIAPPGYTFGGQEGDGACIGWFKYEVEDLDELDPIVEKICAVEDLWEGLEDVTMIEGEDGELYLSSDYAHWTAGASRMEIWAWFNDNHPRGVAYLHDEHGKEGQA